MGTKCQDYYVNCLDGVTGTITAWGRQEKKSREVLWEFSRGFFPSKALVHHVGGRVESQNMLLFLLNMFEGANAVMDSANVAMSVLNHAIYVVGDRRSFSRIEERHGHWLRWISMGRKNDLKRSIFMQSGTFIRGLKKPVSDRLFFRLDCESLSFLSSIRSDIQFCYFPGAV